VTRWFADKIKTVDKKKTRHVPEELSEDSFFIIDINRNNNTTVNNKPKATLHSPIANRRQQPTSTVSFSEESFVIIDDEDITPGGPDTVDDLVDGANRMNISGTFPFPDAKIYDTVLGIAQKAINNNPNEEVIAQHIFRRSTHIDIEISL